MRDRLIFVVGAAAMGTAFGLAMALLSGASLAGAIVAGAAFGGIMLVVMPERLTRQPPP